jgi:hypothetical protein
MDTMTDNLVAGVFTSRARAEAASKDLLRIGLTEHDVELGAPAPGRYRLEDRESAELGRGAMIGVAIGVPVGAVIAIGLLMAAVPRFADTGINGIALGAVVGGYWGIFFGGLGGVVPKVLAQEHGSGRCEIREGGPETIVVVHAGEKLDDARAVLQRRGGRCFAGEVPTARTAFEPQALGQPA